MFKLLRNNVVILKQGTILYKNRSSTSLVQTYNFSTSSKQNAIPPIIWIILKPVSKIAAAIIGRGLRTWWKDMRTRLTPQLVRAHLQRNNVKYALGTSTLTLSGFVFYQTHLQTAPITGRKRFILFLPSQMDDVEEIAKKAVCNN